MTFTPKFVDMVRNVTTVQGTGAVTLGAAVSGYTSLAAAVIAGDQFYYCIQGVDKPAEREVGRGTMQANGTVARQAISGAQTNFTLGTKTIALVAAAEWFDKLDQLAASGTATAAPAGWPLGLFTAAGGAVVPAGVTTAETSGYAAAGQGSARYQYDAAVNAAFVTANPRTAFLAADGRGFRLNPGHRLTVEMFGGKADYAGNPATATDNLAALMAALQFQPDPARKMSPIIHLGIGSYYASATIEPRCVFHLKGQGGRINAGTTGYTGTRIVTPTDTLCLLIANSNTIGQTAGAANSAQTSIVEGICFEQATQGTNLNAHGIQARGTPDIRDCAALTIAGDGFHISATATSGGATEGDVNNWRVTRCYAQQCGGNGLYVQGGDANAGICNGFVTHPTIGGCGVIDMAYYVNSYTGLQLTGFGDGGVHYGGRHYQLVTADASLGGATTPGTNAQIWYDLRAGSVQANFPTWVSGASYRLKLPLFASGAPVVVGPYQEQGSVVGHAPGAMIIGGNLSCTSVTPRVGAGGGVLSCQQGIGHYRSTGGDPTHPAFPYIASAEYTYLGSPPDATEDLFKRAKILRHGVGAADSMIWGYEGANNDLYARSAGLGINWSISGGGTARTYGRATVQPGIFTLHDFALSSYEFGGYDDTTSRIMGIRPAAPAAGYHAQGEFYFNTAPTASGTLGWSCTTAGTPGTFTAVPVVGSGGGGGNIVTGAFTVRTSTAANQNIVIDTDAATGQSSISSGTGAIGIDFKTLYTGPTNFRWFTNGTLVGTLDSSGLTVNGSVTSSGDFVLGGAYKLRAHGGGGIAQAIDIYSDAGGQGHIESGTLNYGIDFKTLYAPGYGFRFYPQAGGLVATIDTSGLKLSSGSFGYATGAGGSLNQATSKSTGVTLDKVSGQVGMNAAALAAGASVSFTLSNSVIAATDVLIVNISSGASADSYEASVTAVAAGSCRIQLHNISAGSLAEAVVLNFALIKAVAA